MKLLALGQFLIMIWGFGVALTFFVKESKDGFERNIMRFGLGLASFLVFMIVINIFHIPLDWKVPFFVSLIGPAALIWKKKGISLKKPLLTKSGVASAVVFVLFLFSFYMQAHGAFAYPWLEDTDPYIHSMGVKFLSIEKSIHGQEALSMMSYIDPYPPGYDILMATLYQVSHSMTWTLKFFNALIIASGVLFFYFMVKKFSEDYRTALAATVAFTFIPCYLSHFIWAHSLVMTLFLVAFYAIVKIRDDPRWMWVAMIAVAGVLFSQPSKPIKMSVMIIIFLLGRMIALRDWQWKEWSAIGGGLVIGLFWYGTKVGSLFSMQNKSVGEGAAVAGGVVSSAWSFIKGTFRPGGGTATRVYTFDDFFVAQGQNMINNPVGVGMALYLMLFIALCLIFIKVARTIPSFKGIWKMVMGALSAAAGIPLVLLAIRYLFAILGNPVLTSLWIDLFAFLGVAVLVSAAVAIDPKTYASMAWIGITLWWLVFTFLGVNSLTFNLPVGFYAFRFWMLFAIPACMVMAEGLMLLFDKEMNSFVLIGVTLVMVILLPVSFGLKAVIAVSLLISQGYLVYSGSPGIIRHVLAVVLIAGVILTSGVQKYEVNTAMWPPQPGASPEELATYDWLYTLPFDTPVYDFGGGLFTIARDKHQCYWCEYSREIEEKMFSSSADELYLMLKEAGYQYAMVGGNIYRMQRQYINESLENDQVQDLVNTLGTSERFRVVHQGDGAIIFKLS